MLWLLLPLLGHAQETTDQGFDARGFTLAASDADLRDPLVTWRPEKQEAGTFSLQALGEFADDPFVVYTLDQDVLTREAVIDDLFGVNLMGHVAVHERLAITATVPMWLSASSDDADLGRGFAAGDLRVTAPLGIAMPDPYEGGFGLSVVPFLDVPTGTRSRYLGNNGISGGGIAAVGYSGRIWELDGNLGVRGTPGVLYETGDDGRWNNLTGGSQLLASAAGAVQLGDHHALRAETHYRAALDASPVQNSQSPGEALLSMRGRYDNGLSWTAGGGTGLNGAAGSARVRLFAGLGYVFGKALPKPILAWLDVKVVDPDGNPIEGAMVSIDMDAEEVDDRGMLHLDGLEPGERLSVIAEATGYDRDSGVVDIVEGENVARLVLEPRGGVLTVNVTLDTGEPVDAAIVLMSGERSQSAGGLGDDGTRAWKVPPGQWTAVATAPDLPVGKGSTRVEPGKRGVIDITLARPKVEIVAEEIVLPEKVHFEFDTAILVEDSVPILAEVARILLANPDIVRVEIAGHTDVRGTADYNQDLSQRRTQAVKDFLVSRGVDVDRLVPRGYGESQPLATGDSEEDHALNRRVQFFIKERSVGEGSE